MNQTIIDTLKSATESLRVDYLTKTQEWALTQFERLQKRASNKPHSSNYLTEGRFNSYNAKGLEYHADYRAWDNATKFVRMGEAVFTEREARRAEQHYQDSIVKLSDRIERKGLDPSKLSVVTARLGQNFEATITDGSRTVRAFTVIAWGPIQRPHYRFLVK